MNVFGRLKGAWNVFRQGVPGAVRFIEGQPLRSDQHWLSTYGGGFSQDGRITINETTALNLSAVWAAVRVISGAVSILPAKVYDKAADGSRTEVAPDPTKNPAAVLASQQNSEMTPITYWETAVTHALMWGNHYSEIEFNAYRQPVALWPIPPNVVSPDRKDNGKIVYKVQDGGKTVEMPPEKIFHIPGLGWDGLKGYSVISMARQSLEVAASYEEGSRAFAQNSFRPSGALVYPNSLQQLGKIQKQEEMKTDHAGVTKWGKMLLLYGGMDWKPFGIPMTDAQFLETRTFQIAEIARWFNVPQHMLRELTRATFSNIEHQGQDFVTYTLMYWLTKIAHEWKRKLLVENPTQYLEHTVDALLRADTITRYRAYGLARQWGFMSANDIRKRENLEVIGKGGDEYLVPVNMRPAGSPYVPPKGNNQSGGPAQ